MLARVHEPHFIEYPGAFKQLELFADSLIREALE
jgi:hypothetical protein